MHDYYIIQLSYDIRKFNMFHNELRILLLFNDNYNDVVYIRTYKPALLKRY